jgi:hypothetical protein
LVVVAQLVQMVVTRSLKTAVQHYSPLRVVNTPAPQPVTERNPLAVQLRAWVVWVVCVQGMAMAAVVAQVVMVQAQTVVTRVVVMVNVVVQVTIPPWVHRMTVRRLITVTALMALAVAVQAINPRLMVLLAEVALDSMVAVLVVSAELTLATVFIAAATLAAKVDQVAHLVLVTPTAAKPSLAAIMIFQVTPLITVVVDALAVVVQQVALPYLAVEISV